MEGKGVYDELDPSLKARIDAVASRVRLCTQVGQDAQPLSYTATEKHIKSFGPELFIGLTLAEKYPHREYLLIKKAVGGTTLYGAWTPDWTEEKAKAADTEEHQKAQLYREHVAQIRANLHRLEATGSRCEIVALFWMQGEADTRKELTATRYEANLANLIKAYRAEFDRADLPFIFGQINCPLRGKHAFNQGPSIVRQAMANVADKVPHTAMIPTSTDSSWSDYPKHTDDLHYNTIGLSRLGTAMAHAFLRLTEDAQPKPDAGRASI